MPLCAHCLILVMKVYLPPDNEPDLPHLGYLDLLAD
jgi:hypothetical protein